MNFFDFFVVLVAVLCLAPEISSATATDAVAISTSTPPSITLQRLSDDVHHKFDHTNNPCLDESQRFLRRQLRSTPPYHPPEKIKLVYIRNQLKTFLCQVQFWSQKLRSLYGDTELAKGYWSVKGVFDLNVSQMLKKIRPTNNRRKKKSYNKNPHGSASKNQITTDNSNSMNNKNQTLQRLTELHSSLQIFNATLKRLRFVRIRTSQKFNLTSRKQIFKRLMGHVKVLSLEVAETLRTHNWHVPTQDMVFGVGHMGRDVQLKLAAYKKPSLTAAWIHDLAVIDTLKLFAKKVQNIFKQRRGRRRNTKSRRV